MIPSLLKNFCERISHKFEKLSHHQNRALRQYDGAVKTFDGIELTVFVIEILPYLPDHTIEGIINEIQILVEISKIVICVR